MTQRRLGLALGAGGLRGLAHVGVLQVLEEEGIAVDCIAGCSIGALVGAMYCAGHKPQDILKLACHLPKAHWLDMNMSKLGMFSGRRIWGTMDVLLQKKTFAQLNIPLRIVAADLKSGKEVVFAEGPVAAAVRASVSVPGVFLPFEWEDMLLVDGAVLNPVPSDLAREMGVDVVVAVDLTSKEEVPEVKSFVDVMLRSIDIMERELLRHKHRDWDVLLQPNVGYVSPSSFNHLKECVALGRVAAQAALPAIQELLSGT